MKFQIIQKRKAYFIFSTVLILISALALSVWRLNLGIDFTGGSILEVSYNADRPALEDVKNSLFEYDLGELVVQPVGSDGYLMRFRDVDQELKQNIITSLEGGDAARPKEEVQIEGEGGVTLIGEVGGLDVEVKRFETIGPTIGQELKEKAFIAIGLALAAIILYIAWAFRKISKPVASWKYGLGAIVALAHDMLIILGVYAVLGNLLGWQVDILFITALLTILGFSVHDTIVVYDRIRENLLKGQSRDFEDAVNNSVNETITRSINTSLTTALVLLALYFLGGETIKQFTLVLFLGIVIGTYSSIFIASPLMVVFERWRRK
jgi:preprotein translocase subunit SecF